MRNYRFNSKLGAAAMACLAVLLLASLAPAQEDNDADRDESRSSARGENQQSREGRNENNSGARSTQRSRSNRQQGQLTLGVMLYNDDSNPLEIRRVLPGSAAENAGLERGDEILTINGRRVANVEQLKRAMARAGSDEEFEIGFLRDGRKQTADASLSTRRFSRGDNRGQSQWNQRQYRNQQQYGQMRDYDDQGYNDAYGDEGDDRRNRDERFANRGQQYGAYQAGNRGYSRRGSRAAGNWEDDNADQRYSEGFRGDEQSDRAFLGVTLDERARDRVRVSDVYPDSPAEEAGLRRGDEIVAIDDEEVESNRDLQRLLSQRDPDDDVTISVERNGRERTLQATLAAQREVFASSRASYRTGRRNGYQQDYGDRDSYRDGYGNTNNRRRQRDDSQEDEEDDD